MVEVSDRSRRASSPGRSQSRSKRTNVPRGAGFFADLKDLAQRYNKRTSAQHKRLVLIILFVGIALRTWMLLQPIAAQEAFMWVHYGMRSALEIISDMSHPENQVLHTLLAKWSMGIFGSDLIALRLPAFLASIASMPLFYLFVRSMFNRYIALIALAMVAGSGGLIEYGALANGQAIVWFFMTMALVFGRHFTQENDALSAVGMGISLALGMWASPYGLYPAFMVLLWSLFHLLLNHSDSLPARMQVWSAGFGSFLVLALVLYAPIINNHGLDQLFLHDTSPDQSWKRFKLVQTEGIMDLWFYIVDMGSRWFSILGLIGLVAAAAISQKYRVLAIAMLVSAAVPVLLVRYVPEPEVWLYTLYIFHLSSAIALFYLLKLAQEKVFPKLGKRTRVSVAALSILVLTAVPAMRFLLTSDRVMRFPEAAPLAMYLNGAMEGEDRVYADLPWKEPLLFHMMCYGKSKGVAQGVGPLGSHIFVVIDPGEEQTMESVLAQQGLPIDRIIAPELMFEEERVKVLVGKLGPESE